MIKFNWEVIKKYTNKDPEKVLKYFENVFVLKGGMFDFLTENRWAMSIYVDKSDKNNYLLDIDQLIINETNATEMERYVYLDLASKRDYFTYMNTKGTVTFLPLWKNTYEVDKLKLNRLLNIESNNIFFIYEGE